MKYYKEITVTFTAECTKVLRDVSEVEVEALCEYGTDVMEKYLTGSCCNFDNIQVRDCKVFMGEENDENNS